MKIAVITDHIPSKWAHSINTMKHAQGFFKLGQDVEVLALRRINEELNRFKVYSIHDFYAISHNINLRFFRDYSPYYFKEIRYLGQFLSRTTNQLLKYFPKFKKFFNTELKISNYCKKTKVDLAYCRRSDKIAYYNILNKIPTVIESHLNFTNYIPQYSKLLFRLSKNQYFKGIVTIHEVIKNKIIKQGVPEEKILVFEDVADLENFNNILDNKQELRRQLGLDLDKKIVMYCGSLLPGKAIRNILETAKKSKENLLFYIIGGFEKDIKYWSKRAKREKIKNIVFLGFKENIFIPKYLKSADILLMPYDLNENKHTMDIETTSPLKIFEYMSSQNPIISSKIPTIEKIVTHEKEALLAQPGDIDKNVEFIEILLRNNQLAKNLSKNAFNKVKNYTYQKRCAKILRELCS